MRLLFGKSFMQPDDIYKQREKKISLPLVLFVLITQTPVGKTDCLDFLVEAHLDFVFFLLARHRLSELISALASLFDFLIYSLNSSLCFLVLRFVPYVFFILRNFSLGDMGQSVVLIVL